MGCSIHAVKAVEGVERGLIGQLIKQTYLVQCTMF